MNESLQTEYRVRPATESDVPAILRLYNHHVLTSAATFDTEPETEAARLAWFRSHGPEHPILVLEHEGEVRGWASLSEWSTRCAYAKTAEDSIYLDEALQGRGAGRLLLERLLEAGREAGLRTVIARVATTQTASLRLHERVGFRVVGTMERVGEKFGKLLDVCIMQYIYDSDDPAA